MTKPCDLPLSPPPGLYDVHLHLRYRCPAMRHVGGPAGGKVAGYAQRVVVENASFRVQASGLRRARRDGQRNVHAFVRGYVTSNPDVTHLLADPAARVVRYNPFVAATFFLAADGRPIQSAGYVVIDGTRMVAFNIPEVSSGAASQCNVNHFDR